MPVHTNQSINTLSRAEARKLEDFISAHKAEIEKHNWTMVQFADFAAGKLGRPIKATNVKSACKALEMPWPNMHGGQYIKAKAFGAAFPTAVQLLVQIAGELGTPIPPILAEIAERNKDS